MPNYWGIYNVQELVLKDAAICKMLSLWSQSLLPSESLRTMGKNVPALAGEGSAI